MEAKHTILVTIEDNNIGQVQEHKAEEHIKRLNAQTGKVWRKDYSDYLFTTDHNDHYVYRMGLSPNNPCERGDGYVWVTCEPESENSKLKQVNAELLEALGKVLSRLNVLGRQGCTWGDTYFDSLSYAAGYNAAQNEIKDLIEPTFNKAIKGGE